MRSFYIFQLPSKQALTDIQLICTVHQTSELGVQKVGKKRGFSVLKMLSLPCYLGIATTLKPNKCDQTARAEKGHKEREKKER